MMWSGESEGIVRYDIMKKLSKFKHSNGRLCEESLDVVERGYKQAPTRVATGKTAPELDAFATRWHRGFAAYGPASGCKFGRVL
uniref:Uncharacterized protein n=1 Tax=Strigamia maritima TaxID=126957 RepID=T1IL14_STRMM